MTNAIYLRGDAARARHHINDFFESHGLGRPVGADDVDGHLSAVTVDGVLCGAAYAAAAMSIADSLLLGGWGIESVLAARRFHAVEALVVSPGHRGQGHGTNLLASIAAHAERDYSAEYMLAHVEKAAPALRSWFTTRGFNVLTSDELHTADGIPLLPFSSHREAWLHLTRPMHRSVQSVPTAFAVS